MSRLASCQRRSNAICDPRGAQESKLVACLVAVAETRAGMACKPRKNPTASAPIPPRIKRDREEIKVPPFQTNPFDAYSLPPRTPNPPIAVRN